MVKNILILLGILLFSITHLKAADVYVDGNNGDDNNTGSLSAPFRTIQKAADVMQPGDICHIRCGVYRETVTLTVDSLTFKNYANEYVLITGLDVIPSADFQVHQGGIFKATVTDTITQVFLEGDRIHWARWPNEDENMLNRDDMRLMDIDTLHNGTNILGKVTILDSDVLINSKPPNYWVGAYVVDVALNRNIGTANKGRVIESNADELIVDDISFYWRAGEPTFLNDGGVGYLIGHLGLLDEEKEWYWENNELYLFPPTGTNMSSLKIEARTRTYGFNLSNRTGVRIEGLHFKAAAIQMENTTNCVVNQITSRFGSPFSKYFTHAWGDYSHGDAAIHISGVNNVVQNSYIGHTWGHGISLWADFSTLDNNLIEQCDWMGERMSPIFAPGNDNTITHNTINEAGRDGIELGNQYWISNFARRATVKYNHIYNCGYLCPDAGSIYVNHQGYDISKVANSEIAFNIIHDFKHPWFSAWGGIYLDNGSSGYKVHHNIIWNTRGGIKANAYDLPDERVTREVEIYHNTIINTITPVRLEFNYNPVTKPLPFPSTEVIVKNNLANDARMGERRPMRFEIDFYGTELVNNRCDGNGLTSIAPRVFLSEFVDSVNHDYRLVASSPSINKGVIILGINDIGEGKAIGTAPDLGAIEYGGIDWTLNVGATITTPLFVNTFACNTEQMNNTKNIIIYPNPTIHQITIEADKMELENIQIFNTLGQDITKNIVFVKNMESQVIIDLSNLSSGMYFIKTKTATNKVSKK